MPRICISYRRADSRAIAGRIHDRLVGRYGAEAVFMDVSDIPYGVDFREHIQRVFGDTRVLVAVIGPEWLGGKGKRRARIQERDDPIRVEINTALRQKIDVIPVLIDHVKMPPAESLPADIQEFAFRNAMRLDSGVDFQTHIERLMAHIDTLMPDVPRTAPAATGNQAAAQSRFPAALSGLLPYALTTIVLLLLAHYLIVMKFDIDPIYLRIAAIVIPLACGFLLFQRQRVGAGPATILGLCVSVAAALGMTAIVGLIDEHSLLPSDVAEWQEAFEYVATITLATAAGNVLARIVPAGLARRSGTV